MGVHSDAGQDTPRQGCPAICPHCSWKPEQSPGSSVSCQEPSPCGSTAGRRQRLLAKAEGVQRARTPGSFSEPISALGWPCGSPTGFSLRSWEKLATPSLRREFWALPSTLSMCAEPAARSEPVFQSTQVFLRVGLTVGLGDPDVCSPQPQAVVPVRAPCRVLRVPCQLGLSPGVRGAGGS